MHLSKWLSALFALILAFGLFASTSQAQGNLPSQVKEKILVDASDTATLSALKASGAVQLVDYGAFSLWMRAKTASSLQSVSSATLQPVSDDIFLRGKTLTPLEQTGIPAPSLAAPEPRGFWMVQFIGPILPAWVNLFTSQGLAVAAYLPNDAFVVFGDQPAQKVADLAVSHPEIRWNGAYLPEYRLSVDLRGAPASPTVDVSIQVWNTPQAAQTIAQITALAMKTLRTPDESAGFINFTLTLPTARLAEVASLPDVFDVESWAAPTLQDEMQGQILAGNITVNASGGTTPNAPGYLNWLQTNGFPTDPAQYPVVDIMDDGIDQGNAANPLHPDFYQLGIKPGQSRILYLHNCTTDLFPNGVNGHGNLNAGIVAGFNNTSGSPYQDADGFHLGLGISPFGRFAGTKLFNNAAAEDLSNCSGSYVIAVSSAYTAGASITSNSWGNGSSFGGYTPDSQTYDVLTRDAAPAIAGNQPMLHIFSAGNSGSGVTTITAPGTAKNVLTVGATQSTRDPLIVDRCGHVSSNNADDIATFSSRGPTQDGRIKPDLMAPGVHIQAQASQDPAFTGNTICGNYQGHYPAGQTLYSWSTGTSHAAPAIAGEAQLAYEYYQRVLAPGVTPSPAMVKALLINSARYLKGVSANDTLPSAQQGWGDANLGALVDSVHPFTLDQLHLFTQTGEQYTLQGAIVDSSRPLRITLTWTDAPGATTGNAYVNNLDLEVTINGQVYKGNHFQGDVSIPGGNFDPANNVENVFLPAGQTGSFQVRVIASNLAGDGVPGNASPTDQDFALVASNINVVQSPQITLAKTSWTKSAPQNSAWLLPGDAFSLWVDLSNHGNQSATQASATLAITSGSALIGNATSLYPDIVPGATVRNLTAFQITIPSNQPCPQSLQFALTVTYAGDPPTVLNFSLPIGIYATQTAQYYGPPLAIPDNTPAGVSAHVFINDFSSFGFDTQRVTAQVDIQHSFDNDLILTLLAPGGQSVLLSSHHGSSGKNYTQTIFDDSASLSISQGTAPFTGAYRPDQPLSDFLHATAAGKWQLNVVDGFASDTGTLTNFSITVTYASCNPKFSLILPLLFR